jgi:hypothetical protein
MTLFLTIVAAIGFLWAVVAGLVLFWSRFKNEHLYLKLECMGVDAFGPQARRIALVGVICGAWLVSRVLEGGA